MGLGVIAGAVGGLVLAIGAVAPACSAPDAQAEPAVELCSLLSVDGSPNDLYPRYEDQYAPREFAVEVAIWVNRACPTQVGSNDRLRDYLRAHDIDPDLEYQPFG